jgi:cysteine-rich repeat protein
MHISGVTLEFLTIAAAASYHPAEGSTVSHRTAAAVFILCCAIGAPARADVDMTGQWEVTTGFGAFCLDVVQTGTTLSSVNCGGDTSFDGGGSVDPMTGMFTITGGSIFFCPPPPGECVVCGPSELSGTTSPDGLTLSGTFVFPYLQFPGTCILIEDPAAGARLACGDGSVQTGEQCDDGNTADGDCCSSTCLYEPAGSACVSGSTLCDIGACDAAGVCVAPVCRSAGASNLVIKSAADEAKDRWVWKWRRGPLTTPADFGDPTTGTEYAFCLSAGTAQAEIAIPADAAKWRATSKGYRYNDAAGAAGGVTKVLLKSGDGNAKVLLRGKGANLPDPMLGDVAPPVTARLIRSDGTVCFESVFTSADIIKHSPTLLKAKAR